MGEFFNGDYSTLTREGIKNMLREHEIQSDVSERELSSLGFLSALGGVLITLFGVAAGAAIALKITLNTVVISDVQTHANYFAAYLVAVGFTIACGACAAVSLLYTFFDVRRIKSHVSNRV